MSDRKPRRRGRRQGDHHPSCGRTRAVPDHRRERGRTIVKTVRLVSKHPAIESGFSVPWARRAGGGHHRARWETFTSASTPRWEPLRRRSNAPAPPVGSGCSDDVHVSSLTGPGFAAQSLGGPSDHVEVDALVFLRDPLGPQPHEPDPGRSSGWPTSAASPQRQPGQVRDPFAPSARQPGALPCRGTG